MPEPSAPIDVAIVAALAIELEPIRSQLEDRVTHRGQFRIDRGRLAGASVALIESGPGSDAAVRAARVLAMSDQPRVVVTCGLAGGLVDGLPVGATVFPSEVVTADELASTSIAHSDDRPQQNADVEFGPTGQPIPISYDGAQAIAERTDWRRGRLVTAPTPVATADSKRRLARSCGASAVDMESYGVVAWCAEHDIPCLALRVISDAVDDTLPPIVNALVFANPWEQAGRVAGTMLRRPAVVKELWHLRARALEAADRLSDSITMLIRAVVTREKPAC